MFKQNQHREIDLLRFRLALGLWPGSKSDKPTARAKTLWRRRRSRLAQNIKRKRIKMSGARGSVTYCSCHAFSDNGTVQRRDFDHRAFNCTGPAVAGNARLQEMPAVH